ncbi:hypothetical protein HZ994_13450 [Akkermansiaceae bacterium]|nr:hypothetical protein HZ994_13450 [Akkermansiaceae bacterium]
MKHKKPTPLLCFKLKFLVLGLMLSTSSQLLASIADSMAVARLYKGVTIELQLRERTTPYSERELRDARYVKTYIEGYVDGMGLNDESARYSMVDEIKDFLDKHPPERGTDLRSVMSKVSEIYKSKHPDWNKQKRVDKAEMATPRKPSD